MNKNSLSSQRQKRLFADKNIWVSVLIVSVPALILGLMAGLFAFCDQLMMVKLIPKFLSPEEAFGSDTYG
jgi:hypothetical protein